MTPQEMAAGRQEAKAGFIPLLIGLAVIVGTTAISRGIGKRRRNKDEEAAAEIRAIEEKKRLQSLYLYLWGVDDRRQAQVIQGVLLAKTAQEKQEQQKVIVTGFIVVTLAVAALWLFLQLVL